MFEGMFNSEILMWVFLISFIVIGILISIAFLVELGIIDDLKDKFKRKKEPLDFFNFNPFFLLFGGIVIFFMFIIEGITNWFKKHRYTIIFIFVNLAVLTPLGLLIGGVIESLPEIFSVLYLFYFMILGISLLIRNENKKYGYSYQNNDHRYSNSKYDDKYKYTYGYQSTSNYKPKPKPKGLPKEEIEKKKKEIRDKLIMNEELKNKYNL